MSADKRTFPKTVEGARKKGWTAVYFTRTKESQPWLWFAAGVKAKSVGNVVNIYHGYHGTMLFELAGDALFAAFKHGGVILTAPELTETD